MHAHTHVNNRTEVCPIVTNRTDYRALGPLCTLFPGPVLVVVCVCCCSLPLAKCGKRAARRGPKHALLAMFGSKRLKTRADVLLSTAAGRFMPRAALPWVVRAAVPSCDPRPC